MTIKRQDSPFPTLCQFQFSDGRACALPAAPSMNGFCRSHAALNRRKPPVEDDLSGIMSTLNSESGLDVHSALKEVFLALAGNRISPRRASAFGYLGFLMLLSKPRPESEKSGQHSPQYSEATVQSLLSTLREKFPERPPIPPGRDYRNHDVPR